MRAGTMANEETYHFQKESIHGRIQFAEFLDAKDQRTNSAKDHRQWPELEKPWSV